MEPIPYDGLLVREKGSGPWTLDKLEIVRLYLERFGTVCRRKAPVFYFVDAFAGPGVNKIEGVHYPGTPLLALENEPQFARCLMMDLGRDTIGALEARTAKYGDRAVVVHGDSTIGLVPTMTREFNRWNPCLCLLDVEGSELKWTMIRDLAGFRRGKRKVEQLILLPTHLGFLRTLDKEGNLKTWARTNMTDMFGTDAWERIYRDRVDERITTELATARYVQLYADQLRALRYTTVLERPIRDRGRHGPLRYFLIFATDHDAGEKIMDSIFDNVDESRRRDSQMSFDIRTPRPRVL